MSKKDIITSIIKESEAYSSMSLIETYVDRGMDLSGLPVQPLYLCLKSMPVEKAASFLVHFSEEQRTVFYNLDLWKKDSPDPDKFEFWLKAHSMLDNDDLKSEFVEGEEFLIFLKARFNIWTFDSEDPQYPDHDNYFLTDDTLLLFEFDEEYEYVDEVKALIRHLYYTKGVENAYTFLFKVVQESFLTVEEDLYQQKKSLLNDFGFVDYFDALSFESAFPNLAVMDNHIVKKGKTTGEIDIIGKQQALHNKSLVSFKDQVGFLQKDLELVTDEKRLRYLQFNFVRLVNATITLKDALHTGPVAMTKTGLVTRNTIELGYNYLKSKAESEGSIFERFEFKDLFRIGYSLISFVKKDLRKALEVSNIKDDKSESFLGTSWVEFLDLSFEDIPKFHSNFAEKTKAKLALTVEDFNTWKTQAELFIQLLPFIKKFYETFSELEKDGVLQDEYYMNYNVVEIDFEAVILSSFANFHIGSLNQKDNGKKLGLTLEEFKQFVSKFIKDGKVCNQIELVSAFTSAFGLNTVVGVERYILSLIEAQLEGYDYLNLDTEDFKHVGGPIILTTFS